MQLLDRYRKLPLEVRAAGWYTVCNVLQKGIQFLVIPIYIRLLSVAEYGKYTVFQSWKEILIIFTTLNLYNGIFTKAMVNYPDDRDRYTASMQGLTTVIALLWLAVYLLFYRVSNDILNTDTMTMFFVFGYSILFPAQLFWSVRQRVENKYVGMVIVTLLMSVLTPTISIALLKWTNLRELSIIWGYLLTQSAFGLYFYVHHFLKSSAFFIKKYWIYALKFNIPLIPHYLSLIVLGQADRIMIERYCGNEEAGIYSLAYQISQMLTLLVSAVNSVFVPWGYEKLRTKELASLREISKSLCVVFSVFTIGVVIVAPEIIRIIGTDEYYQAVWVIPSVSISCYVMFCYGFYSLIEFNYDRTKFVMVASTAGATLNIVLNAICIPRFGFIAAGYTTLASYIVLMLMHYLFSRKISIGALQTAHVFDDCFIFVSIVGLMAFGGVSMLFYSRPIIRYVILCVLLGVLLINRKKIESLVTSLSKIN